MSLTVTTLPAQHRGLGLVAYSSPLDITEISPLGILVMYLPSPQASRPGYVTEMP